MAEEEDMMSDFIDLTMYFKSEYGTNMYEFRYHKTDKVIDLLGMSFKYAKAFKTKRFKLLAYCLDMSQKELLSLVKNEAIKEMSYRELPF